MKDLPRESRRPTSTAEHLVPVPFRKAIHLVEGSPVSGQSVVRVMATKDLVEPLDLVPERPVPNVAHDFRKVCDTAAKSRLLRFPADLVFAIAIARAEVGKPQERERFRMFPLHAGLLLRKSTKLHKPGLA